VSKVDITDQTVPQRYVIRPAMIDIRISISITSLPVPNRERATGQRMIGFSADPVSPAVLIIAIRASATGVRQVIIRKPDEHDKDE
jgi:hypothetical protein